MDEGLWGENARHPSPTPGNPCNQMSAGGVVRTPIVALVIGVQEVVRLAREEGVVVPRDLPVGAKGVGSHRRVPRWVPSDGETTHSRQTFGMDANRTRTKQNTVDLPSPLLGPPPTSNPTKPDVSSLHSV